MIHYESDITGKCWSQFRIFLSILLLCAYPLTASAAEEGSYPVGSIGDLVQQLADYLAQPEVRDDIIQPMAPADYGGGVSSIGHNSSIGTRYSVAVNDDAKSFNCKRYSTLTNPDAGLSESKPAFEVPNVDPREFDRIEYRHDVMPLPGFADNYVVGIRYKSGETYSATNSKGEAINGDFLGFIFNREEDARFVESMLKSIKDRSHFEERVEKDLPAATSYDQRSEIYRDIYHELRKQGLKSGFYGAASSVTLTYSKSLVGPNVFLSPSSEQFMSELSRDLAELNSQAALELLRKGYLSLHGEKVSDADKVDEAMVLIEQRYAQMQLDAFESDNPVEYRLLIEEMNSLLALGSWFLLVKPNPETFEGLDSLGISIALGTKRDLDPDLILDYANEYDRRLIGLTISYLLANLKP